MYRPVRYIKMSELACGEGEQVLKATLGSCVGIALCWPQRQRAALAHCLLPDSTRDQDAAHLKNGSIGLARWVDQAVPALVSQLQVPKARLHELKVYLAGGANLHATSGPAPQIGHLNVIAACQALDRAHLNVSAQDVEGHEAMQITVDCASGDVQFFRIPMEA